ncbi:MAG: VCBS repeat-containing protein [Pirellulales bacterium]|nr:VCBS repeat-containing protein [Pirellulales bacterium]
MNDLSLFTCGVVCPGRHAARFLISLVICVLTPLLLNAQVHEGEMGFPEFIDPEIAGTPKLERPLLILGGAKPVQTTKHGLIAPALWDWDGDGRRDLLLGDFATKTESNGFPAGEAGSAIRVYLNVGTDAAPKFTSTYSYARDTSGDVIEVPQWCCIGFTPQFVDLNDDGMLDIITGQYHPGEISWFRGSATGFLPRVKLEQEGNPAANRLQRGGEDFDELESFDYWNYSSASFGDFDGDGDFDLFVGGSALRVSENVGDKRNPKFARRRLLLDIHGKPLRTRVRQSEELTNSEGFGMAMPAGSAKTQMFVVDWNGDGILDILATDDYRSVQSMAVAFFRGVITDDGLRFHPGEDLLPTKDGLKALPGSGTRVYVDDWNRDGVLDLLVGASVATVNGGDFSPELSWQWEDVTEVQSAGKDPGLYPP